MLALAAAGAVPASALAASNPRAVAIVMSAGATVPIYGSLKAYAGRPWPKWHLPPGTLAPRSALLATAIGAYYRAFYARAGVLDASGCENANRISVWAEARPPARATADALIAGLAPDCGLVRSGAPAAPDPIFDPVPAIAKADPAAAAAALRDAAGSNPGGVPPDDVQTFARLDALLDCAASDCPRVSSLPGSIVTDRLTGLASVRGPVAVGADAADALRVEYVAGLPAQAVGWGHLDLDLLRDLDQISQLRLRLEDGNPYAARVTASNLATHVLASLNGKPARFAAFVGRDANVTALAALLHLTWSLPGEVNGDAPPGAALVFERNAGRHADQKTDVVRVFLVAAPLDAMRRAAPASVVPVRRVPVKAAGCPDAGCSFAAFETLVKTAIDPAFVTPV